MFHGSIPADLQSIIYEHAAGWPDTDLFVGCSGNMTIERVLHARPGERRLIHGNDVTAYSSAIGWWLAGQPLPFALKDEHREELGWLEPYLASSTDTLATLMLGTRFFQFVGRSGLYYERMVRATIGQFPTMHAKTVTKLNALTVRLASYYCGDVRDYLRDVVPQDAPVAMFPPFYAGDYESQFASIDAFFDWPAPSYDTLDEDGKQEIIGTVLDRPHWILGLHIERPELRAWLRGVVQTSNRGLPIYVYSSSGPRRVVVRDSIAEVTDLLEVANRFVVVGNTATDDRVVVGRYDVPSSAPHSIANRGFVVSQVEERQVGTTEQARAAARAIGLAATVTERAELTTPPDPRHDGYTVIRWRDALWLEVSWSMELREGGAMRHVMRKAYQ